jgi:hypothetical protein
MFKAFLTSTVVSAVVGLGAGAAQAQPESATRTMVCVDVNGALLAAECRAQPSRLQSREDICLCPRGRRVEAEVCPSGVVAAPQSRAADAARRDILRSRPSLVGATFEGRPLCVPARSR